MNIVLVLTAAAIGAFLALAPQLRGSSAWRATVTPLASIMGSGFLVSAPLVAHTVGVWAPVAMGALVTVAYGIGAMIRFNIRYAERAVGTGLEGEHRLQRGHRDRTDGFWGAPTRTLVANTEKGSHLVLVGAYVVSVSYYLQLLAAFALEQLGLADPTTARILTTVVLVGISGTGMMWGLSALERLETWTVSLNLGTIAALLLGLFWFDLRHAVAGTLVVPELPVDPDPLHGARVLMGLLIVVQGFETSRFLGAEHSAEERIRTMRYAQWTSAVIYVIFVTLMVPLMSAHMEARVTAITGLVRPVASVLPVLITVVAMGSQFSASVADDAGCAGLLNTVVPARLSGRRAYGVIGALAIAVTWMTDALSVISLASRAFALFYALQCVVTALTAWGRPDAEGRARYMVGGAVLALVAFAVAALGVPAE